MKTESDQTVSETQKQLAELRARLQQNQQTMKKTDLAGSSTEFMSLMIKSTGTFEKE